MSTLATRLPSNCPACIPECKSILIEFFDYWPMGEPFDTSRAHIFILYTKLLPPTSLQSINIVHLSSPTNMLAGRFCLSRCTRSFHSDGFGSSGMGTLANALVRTSMRGLHMDAGSCRDQTFLLQSSLHAAIEG